MVCFILLVLSCIVLNLFHLLAFPVLFRFHCGRERSSASGKIGEQEKERAGTKTKVRMRIRDSE